MEESGTSGAQRLKSLTWIFCMVASSALAEKGAFSVSSISRAQIRILMQRDTTSLQRSAGRGSPSGPCQAFGDTMQSPGIKLERSKCVCEELLTSANVTGNTTVNHCKERKEGTSFNPATSAHRGATVYSADISYPCVYPKEILAYHPVCSQTST